MMIPNPACLPSTSPLIGEAILPDDGDHSLGVLSSLECRTPVLQKAKHGASAEEAATSPPSSLSGERKHAESMYKYVGTGAVPQGHRLDIAWATPIQLV